MLFHAGDKMKVYLIAPIISLIAINMIMFTTNSIGIVPASFYFFMLYLPVCAVFVIEFVHIYLSVQWATEAIKTGKMIRLDGLTGLNNRIAFTEECEKLDERLASGPVPFGIALFDLNDLKDINDTYGHEKGDIAIFTLADLITKVFKECDCYRIGGDEFVVLVGEKRLDRIGNMVEEFKTIMKNKDSGSLEHVSAAVGYAVFDNDSNFQSVFNRADQDMYNNKVEMKAAIK
jgi:diguanylate cyclase (GGDEF)-like protein